MCPVNMEGHNGVAVWPLLRPMAASAQSAKLHRVGFLSPGSFDPETYPGRLTVELTNHLAQKGISPEITKRGAEGHLERLPGLVAELVASKVDVHRRLQLSGRCCGKGRY